MRPSDSYFSFAAYNNRKDSKSGWLIINDITDPGELEVVLRQTPKLELTPKDFGRSKQMSIARGEQRGAVALPAPDRTMSSAARRLQERLGSLSEPQQRELCQYVEAMQRWEEQRAARTLPSEPLPIKQLGKVSENDADRLTVEPFKDACSRVSVELGGGEMQQMILRVSHDQPCAVRVQHVVEASEGEVVIGSFNVLFVGSRSERRAC